jgi:hypothetical protein
MQRFVEYKITKYFIFFDLNGNSRKFLIVLNRKFPEIKETYKKYFPYGH